MALPLRALPFIKRGRAKRVGLDIEVSLNFILSLTIGRFADNHKFLLLIFKKSLFIISFS